MSGISKRQVSRLCEEIDDKVKAFLDRPIEGEEVIGPSIVSGCAAPEVLELVEAAFDAVAQLVGRRIMRDRVEGITALASMSAMVWRRVLLS
jgi:hypothetical protein